MAPPEGMKLELPIVVLCISSCARRRVNKGVSNAPLHFQHYTEWMRGVRSALQGIRREHGVAPVRKALATVERVGAMLAHVDRETLKGKRDAALLLFGFASALRRSWWH